MHSNKMCCKYIVDCKPEIAISKSENVYKFSVNKDDSTMHNLANYGELFTIIAIVIRNDGSCRMSRYEGNCFKKVVKTLNAIIVKKTSVQQAKQHLSNCEYKFQLNNGRTKTETT